MSNVYIKFKFSALLLAFFCCALFLTTCDGIFEETNPNEEVPPRVINEEFPLIAGKKNVMTVTNMSSLKASLTFEYGNRAVAAQSTLSQFNALRNSAAPRMDLEAASQFNANPPLALGAPSRSVQSPSFALSTLNQSKPFYVQDKGNKWITITAELVKQGTKCNIWIHQDYLNIITNADALANKFDQIYPLETNLLGFEKGGGTGGDGGIDGDPRIQILVYDIEFDAPQNPQTPLSGTVGYFWGKDEYTQTQLNNGGQGGLKSNEAEIFYIDAEFFRRDPDTVYSTLVHEFQHMINFNRKALILRKSSATWYDEMLAMLAEDVISPLIGIASGTKGHPIGTRIPLFLAVYPLYGVDQWLTGADAVISYSTAYPFGAYLIRNYGGPQLIKAMLDNSSVNYDSVTQALRSVNNDSSLNFDKALEHYAEALLYSTSKPGTNFSQKKSFDRSQTYALTLPGSPTTYYEAKGFDIWKIRMPDDMLDDYHNKGYITNAIYSNYTGGPVTFPRITSFPMQMSGHSVWLLRIEDGLTGNLLVKLTIKPGNADVKLNVESY